MQAELFETLKSALRARGWTYADLATKLGISEPTVKRIFARRDSKLSRLVDICDALDLTLDDLIAQSNRTETTPADLSDVVERQLSENLPALHRALAELNLSFIRKVFMSEDSDMAGFQTQSRHISAVTARHMMRRIEELFRELRDLARQDQLTISE